MCNNHLKKYETKHFVTQEVWTETPPFNVPAAVAAISMCLSRTTFERVSINISNALLHVVEGY